MQLQRGIWEIEGRGGDILLSSRVIDKDRRDELQVLIKFAGEGGVEF